MIKKKTNINSKSFTVAIVLVIALMFFLTRLVWGWTSPSANPPSGGGALYYSGGNVGIGTTTPTTGKLVVSGGKLDMSTNEIINVAGPTASSSVATKGYVDAALGGGSWTLLGSFTKSTGDSCKDWLDYTQFDYDTALVLPVEAKEVAFCINVGSSPTCTLTAVINSSSNNNLVYGPGGGYGQIITVERGGSSFILNGENVIYATDAACFTDTACSANQTPGSLGAHISITASGNVYFIPYTSNPSSRNYAKTNITFSGRTWYR